MFVAKPGHYHELEKIISYPQEPKVCYEYHLVTKFKTIIIPWWLETIFEHLGWNENHSYFKTSTPSNCKFLGLDIE